MLHRGGVGNDASSHAWKGWNVDACIFVKKIVHCFHLNVWWKGQTSRHSPRVFRYVQVVCFPMWGHEIMILSHHIFNTLPIHAPLAGCGDYLCGRKCLAVGGE